MPTVLDIIMIIICTPSCVFFFSELCTFIPGRLDYVIYKHFNVRWLVSSIVGIGIVFIWYYLQKPWYLNDFLGIALTTLFIKFFKITSMKIACVFLFSTLAVDFALALAYHLIASGNYDDVIISKYNDPIEI
jgi:hypothetical protein